jgi:thioredoxin 1
MSTFSELINSDQPVLVDFFAEWCGPCKTMAPVLQNIAAEMGDKVRIIKVDIDKNPAAAAKYNVRSVPTFMIFQKGAVRWQQSGALPQGMLIDVLKAFI